MRRLEVALLSMGLAYVAGCGGASASLDGDAARTAESASLASGAAPSSARPPAPSAHVQSSAAPDDETRPTQAVWGAITRDDAGVLWIKNKVELPPDVLERAAGPDWKTKWLGEQADITAELVASACAAGSACPLGACRLQVARIVSMPSAQVSSGLDTTRPRGCPSCHRDWKTPLPLPRWTIAAQSTAVPPPRKAAT